MARGAVTKSGGNERQLQRSSPVYGALTMLSCRRYVTDSYSAMLLTLYEEDDEKRNLCTK